MCVAEEKEIQILFFCHITRSQEGLFYAASVPVAEQNSFIFQKNQLFSGFERAVVTVAGNLMKRDFGKPVVKCFRIPPAIAQMKNHVGIFCSYSANHIGDVSVRVGKNQNFHK